MSNFAIYNDEIFNNISADTLSVGDGITLPLEANTSIAANYSDKGKIAYDLGNNSIMFCNGTAWQNLGSGSGTVTSITAGSGLSGGTITTSGTISLANKDAFSAYNNVGVSIASGTGVTAVGNFSTLATSPNFNPANGVYTFPASGMYLCSLTAHFAYSTDLVSGSFAVFLNSPQTLSIFTQPAASPSQVVPFQTSSVFNNISMTISVSGYYQAGTTQEVFCYQVSSSAGAKTIFIDSYTVTQL